MKENPIRSLPGIPTLLAVIVALLVAAWLFFSGINGQSLGTIAAAIVIAILAIFCGSFPWWVSG